MFLKIYDLLEKFLINYQTVYLEQTCTRLLYLADNHYWQYYNPENIYWSSRRLQRNNFSSSKTSWRRLVKTPWRRLENVLKTSRKTSWRHVLKTSWRHVFKTSWRHTLKTPWRHVLKTSSRRLGNKQI